MQSEKPLYLALLLFVLADIRLACFRDLLITNDRRAPLLLELLGLGSMSPHLDPKIRSGAATLGAVKISPVYCRSPSNLSGMKYSQLLLWFGQQATDSFGERVKL